MVCYIAVLEYLSNRVLDLVEHLAQFARYLERIILGLGNQLHIICFIDHDKGIDFFVVDVELAAGMVGNEIQYICFVAGVETRVDIDDEDDEVEPVEITLQIFIIDGFGAGVVETRDVVDIDVGIGENIDVEFADVELEFGVLCVGDLDAGFRLLDDFFVFLGNLVEDMGRGVEIGRVVFVFDIDGGNHGGSLDFALGQFFAENGIENGGLTCGDTADETEVDIVDG